nr:plasmid pRiA4b ORF-3 family protein [Erysipelotrichaceae bacterium]
VLVRNDTSLYELGVILGTALGAEFEHMFLFRSGKRSFCDPTWIDRKSDYSYFNKSLKDLGKKFTFIYDTGDDWEFEGSVKEEDIEMNAKDIAFLIEGNGQGIWEDNKYNLMRYLDGEIDLDTDEEDEKRGIYFPWNYEIEKFSDFDTNYDLIAEQEDFSDIVEDNLVELDNATRDVRGFLPDSEEDEGLDKKELDLMSLYDGAFDMVSEYIASYQIMTNEEVGDIFDDLKEKIGEEEALRKIIKVVKDELDLYIDNNEMLKNHSYFVKLNEIDEETYS